jgi:O-antigen/teichoic acid export membrane protein
MHFAAAALREPAAPGPELPLSLRANFSWTFTGNLVYALCQWGSLAAIAKLGTPVLVGQFALALAITAPIVMGANMQLSGVQATDSLRAYHFRDYLTLRLVSTAVALLTIGMVAASMTLPGMTALVVIIVGLTKAVDAVSDIVFGLFRQREQMHRMSMALIINGVLTFAGVTAAMWMTGSLVVAVLASMTASLFTLLAYSGRATVAALTLDEMKPRWHYRTIRSLARMTLPLGLAGMCVSVYGNMPAYFVEHYYGAQALGFYAAVAYAMTAGTVVVGALGQSAVPRLARHWAAGDRPVFWRLLTHLAGLGALIGLGGIAVAAFAGEAILRALYSAEYAMHADLLVWTMVAAGIANVASVLGYGLGATRSFDRLVAPYFAVLAVGVAFCWMLVPRYGLVGAACALGLTHLAAGCISPAIFLSLKKRPI